MSSNKRLRVNAILFSCVLIILIMAVVCISAFLSGRKKDRSDAAERRVIAHIGDFKVTENQFRFFARIILNQEEDTVMTLYTSTTLSDKDEIKKYTSNFTKEYMIRVIEAEAAGVTLTDEESADLEAQFASDYESAKNVDGETLDKEAFYQYYYGISEEEYKEFWRNWYIIDKYNIQCEQSADISEASQKQAFEEYYDILYTYNTSVIPLYIDAEHTKDVQIEKANSILGAIHEGRTFEELLRENSDDEELIASNGEMKFYPANKYAYADVYDWLRTTETGNTGVVQTDTVIYVIRLNSITDFAQMKDTETMIAWTRTFCVNRDLSQLLSSDKYKYEIDTAVYDAVDMSDILKESYDYWTTVWENDKN